jgi:hypothetical protein
MNYILQSHRELPCNVYIRTTFYRGFSTSYSALAVRGEKAVAVSGYWLNRLGGFRNLPTAFANRLGGWRL